MVLVIFNYNNPDVVSGLWPLVHVFMPFYMKKFKLSKLSKAQIEKNIRIISEGSCDTEDWSNDAENSALHHRNYSNRK